MVRSISILVAVFAALLGASAGAAAQTPKVRLILDGGPCTVGVESTVLDLTSERPILLRPGGAMGIAWNTLVARREDAAAILAQAGLEPLGQPPYLSFRHRVDQAIVRDILVARKPA